MEYCNIFIAEYQYNQYNNNIIVPRAVANHDPAKATRGSFGNSKMPSTCHDGSLLARPE